jgi:hypothetical protein
MLVIGDRVKETSTTAGVGTLNLGGPVADFNSFVTGIGNGNSCPYLIDDGNGNWELTFGTVTSGTPSTISRGTFISSSTGSRITFGGTSKTIACVSAAELFLWPGVSASLAESDIASATTTDLGSLTTFRARITGTAAITGFGTQPNTLRFVRFAGILTLTHNATSLILLGGANHTTAAGDVGMYASDASGNWRELAYWRAAGRNNRSFNGAIADPAGTTSSTYVMMGLGLSITPRMTGTVKLLITGLYSNTGTGNDNFTVGKYGTGTAPANGAAAAGTSMTTNEKRLSTPTATYLSDFTYYAEVSGLTLGTTYWFDLAQHVQGGTGTFTKLSALIEELSDL